MKIACIIPSRYASTRLPGKPLRLIAGETLVHRVYERAIKAKLPDIVIVATDHEDIEKEVKSFGGHVMMTSVDHPTGTDRLAEVASHTPDYEIIVNVQGDEPLIDPDVIDRLAQDLIDHPELDQKGEALYFSRSLIPYPRHDFEVPALKHVGIYAYRRDFLLAYAKMAQTPLEKTESLEQLRALEMGYKIGVIEVKTQDIGIDTEEDLKKANAYFKKMKL